MAIRTSNNFGGGFELAPAGVQIGRCFRVIDCGTHVDKTFGKKKRFGWIFWELPNTQTVIQKTGEIQPFFVGKRYNLSHNEKAILRVDLESWYGQHFDDAQLDAAGGFELDRLIGRPALLNIVHSEDKKYANVMAVMPPPAGMTCPPAVMPTVLFGFDPYDANVFAGLSSSMQEFIKASEEWQYAANGRVAEPPGRDGIIPPPGAAPARPAAPVDVPFGAPRAPAVPAAAAARAAGKFEDMEDDIPF